MNGTPVTLPATLPEVASPSAGTGGGVQGHDMAALSKPRSLPGLILPAPERVPSSSRAGCCQDTCGKNIGRIFHGCRVMLQARGELGLC